MPLITCPDCNKEISDAAPTCPQCGKPMISTVETVMTGIQCPSCGSFDYKKKKHTTGAGWGLFFGGIVAAFFTCGAGLVLWVIAAFLSEYRLHCKNCGWVWKV
ncbi:MAG: zinc-ribbon domain-containing protein [Verrucomicrobiia bacterium]